MLKKQISYFPVILLLLMLSSCKDNTLTTQNEQILFEKPGLVDSAVVHECVALTVRFFSDTLALSQYRNLKITFNGLTNSEGSSIKVYYNTDSSLNNEIYSAVNPTQVNNDHSFTITTPGNTAWFELRLYINPPVCGTGEYKFTRARDFKIYGVD